MIKSLPESWRIGLSIDDYAHYLDGQDRRLYLMASINNADDEGGGYCLSTASQIVDDIIAYNRYDKDIPPGDRKPVRLYINSPGGDITEAFAIISAIETSKTPIWTINVGQWSSAAFLIGISGHRRFSLPHMNFLMHEGERFLYGSTSKTHDTSKFGERFEDEVIRRLILRHSRIDNDFYDKQLRVEYYMLPDDALRHGFIDRIVESLDEIL